MAQVSALDRQIERSAFALDELERLDPVMHARVEPRFLQMIEARHRDVAQLKQDLAANKPLGPSWGDFRIVRDRCAHLFQDCLAYLQGSLARQARLDEGLCAIADFMLNGFSERIGIEWKRLAILADGEFFGDAAQIIRLRFPETSIWNLPVAAHEFGHFLVPRIEVDAHTRSGGFDAQAGMPELSRPFQQILAREWGLGEDMRWSFVHEVLADIFATYALGPAYVYTCLVLRFDPAAAHERAFAHPSAAERASLMVATLRRMGAATPFTGSYDRRLDQLERLWQETLSGAGQEEAPTAERSARMGTYLDDLYPLLDESLGAIRYASLLDAEQLARRLSAPEFRPSAEHEIVDVLNAAWLARVDSWGDRELLARIESRARALCEAAVERGTGVVTGGPV